MTYVSRRARIIIPRWPNESDTEFLFRANRRCDGRLKRHSSCLDLRAWINDNCIKYEYLLDLMSDGEVTVTPPLQLYGRFIPVPLLFKLAQNSTADRRRTERERTDEDFIYGKRQASSLKTSRVGSEASRKMTERKATEVKKEASESGKTCIIGRPVSETGKQESETFRPGSRAGKSGDSGSRRSSWQEARCGHRSPDVCSSRSTMNRDDGACGHMRSIYRSESDTVLARALWEKNEIEKHLHNSTMLLGRAVEKLEKIDCIIQQTNEETEIIRKEEIQEAFRKPKFSCSHLCASLKGSNAESRAKSPRDKGRKEAQKCNELLRQISGLREKLKRNQECRQMIDHEISVTQGRVECLSSHQMTEIYNREGNSHLRKLEKKLEKLVNEKGKLLSEMCQALAHLNSLKKSTNSQITLRRRSRSDENRKGFPQQEHRNCICRNFDSSDTDKAHCSDSTSSDEVRFEQVDKGYTREADTYTYFSPSVEYEQQQEELNYDDYAQCPSPRGMMTSYTPNCVQRKPQTPQQTQQTLQSPQGRVSKMMFCCDNLAGIAIFRRSDRNLGTPDAQDSSYRPSTSPTTRRERSVAQEERRCLVSGQNSVEVPGRRVKSETTMQEIEKTLRNYEQRLCDVEGLEYKVEEWKKKLLEACRWKTRASKMESDIKKERDDEREKTNREITGLYSENCELKKQVRELMEKFKEQTKRMQNMKCTLLKAKDLQCETDELKKELSEYRSGYEQQRKCISKWESVVAVQRKEIENLMNHIKKLTTEKKKDTVVLCCQEKKYVQRSRSYSPEGFIENQDDRPQTHSGQRVEGNASCCCQDFRHSDSRRSHTMCYDKNYYSSVNDSDDWCN